MVRVVDFAGSKMVDLVLEKTLDIVQAQELLTKEMLYYLMVVQVKSMVIMVVVELVTKMVAVVEQLEMDLNPMLVMEFKLI